MTNNSTDISPLCHKVFGPRNMGNIKKIADHKLNENLQVYLWYIEKSSNHQKYIIVDDTVIAGSSNFSYKGFNSMSDYEHNVIVKSPELSKQLENHLEIDKKYCQLLPQKDYAKSLNLGQWFFYNLHKYLEEKIG